MLFSRVKWQGRLSAIADVRHLTNQEPMKKRDDPFRRDIWRYRLAAIGSSWRAILLLLALGAGTVTLANFVTRTGKAPAQEEVGRVVAFGSYATDMGNKPLIAVELADGSRKQLLISRPKLQTCRVGDRIRLVRKAGILGVHFRACLAD